MTAARFPVDKFLDGFNLTESSIGKASHDYLVALDWMSKPDNLRLVGPAGTRRSHYLIGHCVVALRKHPVDRVSSRHLWPGLTTPGLGDLKRGLRGQAQAGGS